MNSLPGSDHLGRVVFSPVIHADRISVIAGLGATTIVTTISTLICVLSANVGGILDTVLQRFRNEI